MAMARSSNFLITTVPIAGKSPIAWFARQGARGRQARLCRRAAPQAPAYPGLRTCLRAGASLAPQHEADESFATNNAQREVKMTSLRLWHDALGAPCFPQRRPDRQIERMIQRLFTKATR